MPFGVQPAERPASNWVEWPQVLVASGRKLGGRAKLVGQRHVEAKDRAVSEVAAIAVGVDRRVGLGGEAEREAVRQFVAHRHQQARTPVAGADAVAAGRQRRIGHDRDREARTVRIVQILAQGEEDVAGAAFRATTLPERVRTWV